MQKITPFLWFNGQAEEAAHFYSEIFKDAKIKDLVRYPEGSPDGQAGKLMTATLEIEGQEFNLLNGGPQFRFTEAISFVINCDSQEEVDTYWNQLTADGGQPGQCGWLKDKFGLSWQVIPVQLSQILADPDPERSAKAAAAMLKMQKIDIAALEAARDA